jgi:hypothetical protein
MSGPGIVPSKVMAWSQASAAIRTFFSTTSISNSTMAGPPEATCSCGCTKGGATSSCLRRGRLERSASMALTISIASSALAAVASSGAAARPAARMSAAQRVSIVFLLLMRSVGADTAGPVREDVVQEQSADRFATRPPDNRSPRFRRMRCVRRLRLVRFP